MLKLIKILTAASALALMTACGGGGGGSSAPATTYPFQAAWISSLTTASNRNFTVSGTANTYTATGSGTDAQAAITAGTFRGTSCQQQVETVTGSVTVNSTTNSLNATNTSFYDSNYNYLGQIGSSEYLIVDNGSWNLPATVTVGSSGTIYTGKTYRDNTFATQIGTETGTYSISNDTVANSALATLVITNYDLTGTVTSTDTEMIHVYTNGTSSNINANSVSGNINLTITYQ